ncbi:hypothetical protein HAX54_026302, partial [Datura stramonium]|nr:hypothetical protein [Datura stramonium]
MVPLKLMGILWGRRLSPIYLLGPASDRTPIRSNGGLRPLILSCVTSAIHGLELASLRFIPVEGLLPQFTIFHRWVSGGPLIPSYGSP